MGTRGILKKTHTITATFPCTEAESELIQLALKGADGNEKMGASCKIALLMLGALRAGKARFIQAEPYGPARTTQEAIARMHEGRCIHCGDAVAVKDALLCSTCAA